MLGLLLGLVVFVCVYVVSLSLTLGMDGNAFFVVVNY